MARKQQKRAARKAPSKPGPGRLGRWARAVVSPRRWTWRGVLITLGLIVVGLPAFLTIAYRILPPPLTPLMLIRVFEGHGISKSWTSLDAMSPFMARAVIAAEDNLFCEHQGFDIESIREAYETWQEGGRMRGASTISMQTAKNAFLWDGRNWVRKGLEAYLTLWIETFWPKQRIIEVYLNIIEFGPGIYGAAAASEKLLGKDVALLSEAEAARLAVVLPNPLGRDAANPSARDRSRAGRLVRRMRDLGSYYYSCLE